MAPFTQNTLENTRLYRTEAIVLKAYNYGEADKIVTLYTLHHGKVRAIAKGVRRPQSRKSGHLELFARSTLMVARGRQLDVITQADMVEGFDPVRRDLARLTHCHYVAELLESFSAEGQANQVLYHLALRTFRRLAESEQLDLVTRSFEMQLLSLAGYRPELFRCLNCAQALRPIANRWSCTMGGVLCEACLHEDPTAVSVSVEALKFLRYLQTKEEALLQVVKLDVRMQQEAEQRMREYVTFCLERRPRSLSFMDRLRAEGVKPTKI